MTVKVASVSDLASARQHFRQLRGHAKCLRKIWVDGFYRGQLLGWVASRFRFRLDLILRPIGVKGFTLLPRRWVAQLRLDWVERTFPVAPASRRGA